MIDHPPAADVARIAEKLRDHERSVLISCDPDHIGASVPALLSMCLSGIADVRPDNSVLLTTLGLAVRAHILANAGGER